MEITKEDIAKAVDRYKRVDTAREFSFIECQHMPRDQLVIMSQKLLDNIANGRPLLFGCEDPGKEFVVMANVKPEEAGV